VFVIGQGRVLTELLLVQNLIDQYEPFTRGLSTRLERELERLSLPGAIELSTLSKKDEAKQPLMQEGTLLHLDRDSRVEDVVERVRRAATFLESRSSDDEGFDDGYSSGHSGRASPCTCRN
jgi:CRISPR/Cas system-associated protein Cas10 (large subunit of type III CRISPR-Cas system)